MMMHLSITVLPMLDITSKPFLLPLNLLVPVVEAGLKPSTMRWWAQYFTTVLLVISASYYIKHVSVTILYLIPVVAFVLKPLTLGCWGQCYTTVLPPIVIIHKVTPFYLPVVVALHKPSTLGCSGKCSTTVLPMLDIASKPFFCHYISWCQWLQ
jgi:hypothetical protein